MSRIGTPWRGSKAVPVRGLEGGIMGSDCFKGIQCVLGVMCFSVMVTQHCEY